jgi:allantoicase
MDIYPDGGMARLRLFGALSAQGRSDLGLRWFNALSAGAARVALQEAGVPGEQVEEIVTSRPLTAAAAALAPAPAGALLLGRDG